MTTTSRRSLIGGGLAIVGTWALGACTGSTAPTATQSAPTPDRPLPTPTPLAPAPGGSIIEKKLRAAPTTIDLGGIQLETWAYADTVPGPLLEARPGDLLRITLDNQLPADTTIHWHGVALNNAADGVPGMTQNPVPPGGSFLYEFAVPDPGTYFFHPHIGVQLDRGLYAPLIVADPADPGRYDSEWIVVLDDWIDGTGRTPDDVLRELTTSSAAGNGMGGMDHSGMGNAPFGDGGDVTYPHYLINGALPTAPVSHRGAPGERLRLRIINAASDTIFAVALGGHTMTVTHSDGFAVQPHETAALHIGMGERYDVVVTLADGVFPLVAMPWGKNGQAMALVRTGSGSNPPSDIVLPEFTRPILQGTDLHPAAAARLPDRPNDARVDLRLGGQMNPYAWTINGAPFGKNQPLSVTTGQRLQVDVTNATMMTHPLHLHGHTFALPSGLRKDTVLIPPMGTTTLQLDATNPGDWAVHCHNIYHAEAGMMIALQYRQG